jgi:hypothetical protein
MPPNHPAKYDIFLSYSRKDEAIAKRLDTELQARGVRTFLDQKDIDPGAIFEQNIFAELGQSKSYGLIVTQNSLKSAWVSREYEYARGLLERRRMRIIPLLFDAVDVAGQLALHNMLDFRDVGKRSANLNSMIFPGMTGKRLRVWLVNYDASPPWKFLEERLSREHGVYEFVSNDILREWHNGHLSAAEDSRERIIAVVNLFGGRIAGESRAIESARFLFEVRERTHGSANEVVFILFHDPARMVRSRSQLLEAIGESKVERLRRYFQLDITADERRLASDIDVIWNRALQELMTAEHRQPAGESVGDETGT